MRTYDSQAVRDPDEVLDGAGDVVAAHPTLPAITVKRHVLYDNAAVARRAEAVVAAEHAEKRGTRGVVRQTHASRERNDEKLNLCRN